MLPTIAAALAALASAGVAAADDRVAPRAPMPEPLFTETATDIDSYEPRECEYEVNGAHLRSRTGAAFVLQGGIEVECLVTRRLGLRLESTFARSAEFAGALATNEAGGSAAASWKILQDFEHDFHLQAEVAGRVPWSTTATISPGDSALPLVFDLRSGWRRGLLTLRSSVGIAAGGEAAHVPLRGSLAALTGFGDSGRFGFWGIELDVDGSRPAPAVVALDVMPSLLPLGVPVRIGLGLPYALGVASDRPSMGIFIRVLVESDREVKFARLTVPAR